MPEISQEKKDELRDAVIINLFILPAFRLKERQINVLKTYALSQLNNNISQIQLNKNSRSISLDSSDQTSQSTNYFAKPNEFQGFFKIIGIILQMMPKITWAKLGWLIISIIFSYSLVRQNDDWLKLIGVTFFLTFSFTLSAFFYDALILYTLVENTFSFLSRISKEVQLYINSVYLIKDQKEEIFAKSIASLSSKIIKEFINEEIRQTDYTAKKNNVSQLSFAFTVSFLVIYVTGNQFIVVVKSLAERIDIIDFFPAIKDLNVQTFWLIFLFPLSLAWARDLAVEVSKGYRKKLYQSLFLIDLYEED